MPKITAYMLIVLFGTLGIESAAAQPSREQMDRQPLTVNGRRVFPAWETRWEKRLRLHPPKEDQRAWLDAFRAAHPELYGATLPPLQPVRLYAEFEPVDAVYYAWEPDTFDTFFGNITHQLLTNSDVTIYVLHHGPTERADIEAWVENHGDDPADLSFIDVAGLGDYYVWQTEWPYDRALESFWTVDFGPFFVLDGGGTLGVMDPRYYWYRINDDAMGTKLAALQGLTVWRPDLDWEGGNLLSDGAGTCFTTYMHEAENLPLQRDEVEDQLFEYFGCEKVLWLWPLQGEETGHIDMFFKNASETLLLVGEYDTGMDPVNAARLDWNAALLAGETNAAGTPFEVRRFPMPRNDDGIWRSYANGILVNDLVLMPTYTQDRSLEADARAIFEDAFPDRTVVSVDSDGIISWGGAIHCVTRTRPVGTHATLEATPLPACGGDAACATGCGDLTYSGDCVDGIPVYCEEGEAVTEACYEDEQCGWVDGDDYVSCVSAGCGDLTAEGECRTSGDGDTVAVWCEDGYPLADRCPTGIACALDPDVGHVACDDGCVQACAPGTTGCVDDHQAWVCGEADDGDDCRDRRVTACPEGAVCHDGVCGCQDECEAGEGGCDVNGDVWICGEAGDGDDCLEILRTQCTSKQTCQSGQCVDRGGCGCASSGGPTPLWPAIWLLGLWLWIRRRHPRSLHHE